MKNGSDFYTAGLNSGQKRILPTGSGHISEEYNLSVSAGNPECETDTILKPEQRSSSPSLSPREIVVHSPSAGWKSVSPNESNGEGSCDSTGVPPLPLERSGNTAVSRSIAGDGAQKDAQPAGPNAGRSAESAKRVRGMTRFHHHPRVWESHKAKIEEIYMKQNKSLKQLIDIMVDEGFKATPRMYKSKFEQWGFVKNNRSKDVAMMLRLQRQRDAVGKPTTFQRHGRTVDIHNYIRRKGVSGRELAELADEVADLPEYVRCLTPPPPPGPRHMTLPDHLQAQDILVSCFRDLTLGWRDSIVSPESFEQEFNAYFDAELCEATRDFSRACWFFSKGYTAHGALLSQRAFSTLHLLVTKPSALGLFDLLIASVIEPDHGLARELWNYLAAYSKAKLGPTSIFYRLFNALKEVFRDNPLEVGVDFVFACMESIIGMLLGRRDLTQTIAPAISFFLLGDLILFGSSRTDLPALQRAIAASQDIIVADGTDRAPAVVRFLEPAAYLWQYGPHDDLSFQYAQVALRQRDPVSNRFDWIYWVAWRVIAEFHRGRCSDERADADTDAEVDVDVDMAVVPAGSNPRHALARYSLEQAVDAAEDRRGFREVQVFANLQKLEDWHREAGDSAQELAVRRRKEAVLQAYLKTLQNSACVEEQIDAPGSQ